MQSFFQGRRLFRNRISKITNTNYDFYVKKKKVPILPFLLRQNRNSLNAEDRNVLPSFFFYPRINFMITGACYAGKNKHHILQEGCSLLHSRFQCRHATYSVTTLKTAVQQTKRGAAFIRRPRLSVILIPSAAFNQVNAR